MRVIRDARCRSKADRVAIAVMAKASAPGRTKTRLSPPLDPAQAAALNTVFLKDIAENLTLAADRAPIAAFMAFGPPGSAAFFDATIPADIGLIEAWVPDFGACLSGTLATLLGRGYGAAVVLNSDSPTLPTSLLVEAAEQLLAPGERIVLGPSTDGGYYLLGLKTVHPPLFEGIAWSTNRVCAQTRRQAARLPVPVVELTAWYDVDDAASLACLKAETRGVPFCALLAGHPARHTAEYLRQLERTHSPA